MSLHTVVKVGGSLLRLERAALAPLMDALTAAAASLPLLVVPGGGVFDDAVRAVAARLRLSDEAAHWMAVLAMDAYGRLLADLAGSVPVDDLSDADRAARQGRLAVLLPSRLLQTRDELPHAWTVTSDSIAVWVAGACGSRRVVLLKDVDGVLAWNPQEDPGAPMLAQVDTATASAKGAVDAYFDQAVRAFFSEGEIWILNGTAPGHVTALLLQGVARGTRIMLPRSRA